MNRKRTLLVGALAAATLVTGSACGNSGNEPAASSSSTAPASTEAAAAHNKSDVMFAHHMIPHHQQAIEMSDMILAKPDIDPRVSDLATQIKAAQGPEIEQMQDWLTQWGMPTMAMTPGMRMPEMHGPDGGMGGMMGSDGMGMMTQADMDALNNAQGVAASRLFLAQMIEHHQGAITMAQNEIKNGQFPAAITLSRSIVTSQQKEIDTMNEILASLG